MKKPFLQCLLWFDTYCSARGGQKCTKIGNDVVKLSVNTSWKFYQVISKNAGDCQVFANHINHEVKDRVTKSIHVIIYLLYTYYTAADPWYIP